MEVVDLKQEQLAWFPVESGQQLYGGQLVSWVNTDGALGVAGVASGAYDTTNNTVFAGIVVGINDLVQTHDSTYNTFTMTAEADNATQATINARDYFGQEGMFSKGDPQDLVQIAMIDATTRIKIPIFNAAFGTATTLLTVTTGSTAGETCTTNACDVAYNADQSTTFFRSGGNAGLYRVSDDTTTTDPAWDKRFPNDIAVGDTAVRIGATTGLAPIQLDSESIYLNNAASLDSDYYGFVVQHIDCREAGKEHVVGRFIPRHFGGVD